jgi:hypothetical protein
MRYQQIWMISLTCRSSELSCDPVEGGMGNKDVQKYILLHNIYIPYSVYDLLGPLSHELGVYM